MDRLAPDREGPVGPRRLHPGRTPRPREARSATQLVADTQKLYDLVHAKDFTLTIDQISNGAIGLMEEVAGVEDHRRGGDLLAHRPLGLPGQPRGRAGRVRGRARHRRGQGQQRYAGRDEARRRVRSDRRSCSRSTRSGDGFVSYTELSTDTGQGALRRGQRPQRAAQPAHLDHRQVGSPVTQRPETPSAGPQPASPPTGRGLSRRGTARAGRSDRRRRARRNRRGRRGRPRGRSAPRPQPSRRRTRSTARTSRASPRRRRTACTSPPSTSRPASTATGSSSCSRTGPSPPPG